MEIRYLGITFAIILGVGSLESNLIKESVISKT